MISNTITQKIKTYIELLLIISSSATILYLLYYHYSVVAFPWPIQYREGAILLTTETLLKGINPYNFELQPYYSNSYGLIYNLIVLPFASLLGPSLIVHKAVAALFTLLSLALTFYILRRQSIPWKYTLPTIAILYSSLLYSKTSLAEPDSTGVFILLLSVVIPILMKFSPLSLATSILLAGIGFFTKPYFVFGVVPIAVSLIYIREFKKLTLYVFFTTCFILIELFLLDYFCETYIINTILSSYNYGKNGSSWSWVWDQLYFVTQHDIFYFTAAILAFAISLFSGSYCSITIKNRHFLISSLILLMVFILFLGKNTGAFATYIYQLTIPFFCLATATILNSTNNKKLSILIKLLLILSMIAIIRHYPTFNNDFIANEKEWQKAEALILTHKNILNSPAIAQLLLKMNRTVYDSGQTGMYFYGLLNQNLIESKKLPIANAMDSRFKETIFKGITEKRFDLLLTDREFNQWLMPPITLIDYYDYKGFLTLNMPHTNYLWVIDIWEPKH